MVSHMDSFNLLNNYKPQNSKVKPKCMVCNKDTARYAHCDKCGRLCCFNNCLTLIINNIYKRFPAWAQDPSILGKRLCNNCLPPMNNEQSEANPTDMLFSQIFGNDK